MTRHIGGSLLPSSNSRVLAPTRHPFGILQVRQIAEADTHGLFWANDKGESLIATHSNGFSCRELADRMAAGDEKRTVDQVQYILDCGGTAINRESFARIMAGSTC